MPDTEFLVSTVGTTGDAVPFIGLAKELIRRGHCATILTNADHASLAAMAGIPFAAISEPDWPQVGRNEREFVNTIWVPGYYRAHSEIKAKVEKGQKLFLVNRTGNWGSLFCAERYSIPFVNIALQPCAIRQSGHPIAPKSMIQFNEFRSAIGLDDLNAQDGITEPALRTISLFPKWFGEPQSAWPEAGTCVGFPFTDGNSVVPQNIARLVADHGPPVVFSPGTGIQEISHLLQVAKDFSSIHSCPTVFLSRYVDQLKDIETDLFKVSVHASHAILLPQSRLLVHNGGVGACAQAILAGIPQIALPYAYDQPDNAARLESFGLGRSIALKDLTLEAFLNAYDHISGHPDIRTNVALARARVTNERGIEAAIDIVEAVALKGQLA